MIPKRNYRARYLYYDKQSPIRYASKSKMLQYIRRELQNGHISTKQYKETFKDIIKFAKEIDLGTHFQHHRKKIGTFHYSLFPCKNQYFQMDLMDLSAYAKYNQGFKWILFFLNAQTKYLYIRPMKSKKGKEVSIALYSILKDIEGLKEAKYRILIQSDDGKEFFNKDVIGILKLFDNMDIYSIKSDYKAAFVESVIRTIRAPLVKSMEHNGPEWINQVNGIVHNYNNQYHSSIKMSPSDAEINFPLALTNIHESRAKSPRVKTITKRFNKGDVVRILARSKSNHFRKGTLRKWTAEVFTISIVRRLRDKYVYKLKDKNGVSIDGTFDANDLQHASSQSVYKFHVLKTRNRNGVKELYVHWDGFPSSDNSWVKETDIV